MDLMGFLFGRQALERAAGVPTRKQTQRGQPSSPATLDMMRLAMEAASRSRGEKPGIPPMLQNPGMVAPGNIDPNARPASYNPDGSISTLHSASFGMPQGEVLMPTTINGQNVSNEQALQQYRQTGQNLGAFDTPENADTYAQNLHLDQERRSRARSLLAPQPQIPYKMLDKLGLLGGR